jgi:hypothetical protein
MSLSQSQENNILNIDLSDDNETQTEDKWKTCDQFIISEVDKTIKCKF